MAKRKTPKKTDSSEPVKPKYWFDEDEANRAVEFCSEYLTHVKGEWAGRPLLLEDWQKEFVRNLFGWKRADGTRKYRKAFLFIARKNGKTLLGAAIAIYLLLADREPGAEIYSVAADRDQAAIMFDAAKGMVESNQSLSSRCEVYRRSIVVPATGSAYHVLSADAPTKHGKNAHGVLFDELHAQPNRELYDVMKTSQGSRRQPMFLMFTTAGYDKKSVCYEEYEYACKVRDGIIEDDTYLPVIFEADKDADWTDESVWRAASPNLGISPKLEYLQDECNRAKESVAYQNTFRMLYLNQWMEQSMRWIDITQWDACDGHFNPDELLGRPCIAGLDLASTTDIAALALLFPPDDMDGVYRVLWRFWIPEENMIKRSKKDRVPYVDWHKQGLIFATEGNVIDQNFIKQQLIEDCEKYQVAEIAYDRWNSTKLITELIDEGLTMVPFGQGFASMAAPTKEWEKLILGRRIAHNGNPVARWMMSNVAVRLDPAANMKPDKAKSSEKIDGIVAAIMALGRAMVSEESGSVYDDPNVEVWI
jgi:phage terminase large subunit-like protein